MGVVLVLLIFVGMLYLISVLMSWAMIKLVYDEVPARFAFMPLFNLLLPVVDARRTRGGQRHFGANATPQQELDVLRIPQAAIPPVPGPFHPPVRQPDEPELRRRG